MDSPTSPHEQERANIRAHVISIGIALGNALWFTFRKPSETLDNMEDMQACWTSLAHTICDFGEYLDGEDDEPVS